MDSKKTLNRSLVEQARTGQIVTQHFDNDIGNDDHYHRHETDAFKKTHYKFSMN
jgi:hypothetical protein